MVKSSITYEPGFRTQAIHEPSGNVILTDAPKDNNGKGEAFSPTDLVATALGSCMCTIMGIVAERQGINLEGLKVETAKYMSSDSPRRIIKVELKIYLPIPEDHPEAKRLVAGAKGCPVHHSLHPDIETPIEWIWAK